MKILALDSSTKYLSICISVNGKCASVFHKNLGIRHSDLLIEKIDYVFKKAKLDIGDIDVLAIGLGPGSFTGLRIGLAAMKAMSTVKNIPIIGIPTLDIISNNFLNRSEFYLPAIDARKERVYTCIYRQVNGRMVKKSGYMLLKINDLLKRIKGKNALIFGDGVKIYKKELEHLPKNIRIDYTDKWIPNSKILAKIAFEKARKKMFSNVDKLVPFYMHPKECNVKGFS